MAPFLRRLLILSAGLAMVIPVSAQSSPIQKAAQAVGEAAAGPAPAAAPNDQLGRTTPRGAVLGFLHAAQEGDYPLAADYLDLSNAERQTRGPQLASQLAELMNNQFTGHVGQLSDNPQGSFQADVPSGEERIGYLRSDAGDAPVMLVLTSGNRQPTVWLFSRETLAQVPNLAGQLQLDKVSRHLPKQLVSTMILDMSLWVWLGILLLIPAAGLVAWLGILGCLLPVRLLLRRRGFSSAPGTLHKVPGPVWLLVAAFLHGFALHFLPMPLLDRFYYAETWIVVAGVAVAWLLVRTVNGAGTRLQRKIIHEGHAAATSLVILGQRVVKVLLVFIVFLLVLSRLGVNTSALLAGLGIGGLAVALAGQKTLENLFGGATLLGDEVLRVGDVVRAGNVVGVLEDISLRSVRIRTGDRTLVSIPNGVLATMNIENFAGRDKMLFTATITLRHETSTDQLRYVLAETRRMLYSHPRIDQGARFRFTGFDGGVPKLELLSYVLTTDDDAYFGICEDVLLRMLEIVDQAGTTLALPSRDIYVAHEAGINSERAEATRKQIEEWRKDKKLPFPDFTSEAISRMHGTLAYPDPASVLQDGH